ncbi:MAG TPA: DUF2490 domain-containing protein [Chitinophagaceae bacterium]|nr:DUF2490 domain-containing protein [Chitinophagaceae bacterium]
MLFHRAGAQKRTYTVQQTWAGYVQVLRVSERWMVLTDVHFRTGQDFVQGRFQAAARTGLGYRLSEKAQAGAGYAYFHHYPGEGHQKAARPEHRGWQQVIWEGGGRLRLQQRTRAEQRWRHRIGSDSLAKGFGFNHRLRHAFILQYPLRTKEGKPGPVTLVGSEELMVNFGRGVTQGFDQHRFFLGCNWQLHPSFFLQAGYLHIWQQQSPADRFRQSHVARIFLLHNLNLHRKEKGAALPVPGTDD